MRVSIRRHRLFLLGLLSAFFGVEALGHANGVAGLNLVFTGRKISERASIQEFLSLRGFRLLYQAKNLPFETWIQPEFQAMKDPLLHSAHYESICGELKRRWNALLAACSANIKPKPAQSSLQHSQSAARPGVESDSCSLLMKLDGVSEVNAGLSTFWAQEYVGLDLANQQWQKLHRQGRTRPIRALAFDSDREQHGESVTDIMLMHTPTGATRRHGLLGPRIPYYDGYIHEYVQVLDEQKSIADVVNISMRLDASFLKSASEYSKLHNSIFVIAAGNSYPEFRPDYLDFEKGIIVGSLGPDGHLSSFSEEHQKVSITAPSDNSIVSRSPHLPFGGTSGAAPVVSAAMILLKSILPKITIDQAKELLQKTALPTWNAFESPPRLNGAGTLNAPKLLEWASNLREKCPNLAAVKDTKSRSATCFRREIDRLQKKNDKTDPVLISEVKSAFGCSIRGPSENLVPTLTDCKKRKEVFDKLRREAYLNVSVGFYWTLLSCVHKSIGFPVNSEFYEKLSVVGWPPRSFNEVQEEIVSRAKSALDAIPAILDKSRAGWIPLEESERKNGRSLLLTTKSLKYRTWASEVMRNEDFSELRSENIDRFFVSARGHESGTHRYEAARQLDFLVEKNPKLAEELFEDFVADRDVTVRVAALRNLQPLASVNYAKALEIAERTLKGGGSADEQSAAAALIPAVAMKDPEQAHDLLTLAASLSVKSETWPSIYKTFQSLSESRPALAKDWIAKQLQEPDRYNYDFSTLMQTIILDFTLKHPELAVEVIELAVSTNDQRAYAAFSALALLRLSHPVLVEQLFVKLGRDGKDVDWIRNRMLISSGGADILLESLSKSSPDVSAKPLVKDSPEVEVVSSAKFGPRLRGEPRPIWK